MCWTVGTQTGAKAGASTTHSIRWRELRARRNGAKRMECEKGFDKRVFRAYELFCWLTRRMIKLKVNQKECAVEASPDTPLLWVLRESLALTGTKFGCGMAQCGACTVHLNGEAVRSCVTPVSRAAGKQITTIEGLSDAVGRALQRAWIAEDVPQCGYCQSGQIMAAGVLLRGNPNPTDDDIDDGMAGNICRCVAYPRLPRELS